MKNIKNACSIFKNRPCGVEMDIDYSIIEEKVNEMNELGIDITLQEVGDIIESKFLGKHTKADLIKNGEGCLIHQKYTLVK